MGRPILPRLKPELVVGDRHLAPAVAGQPYKFTLSALNAQGNCAWSLSKGRLPDGITLAGSGVLEGKSTVAGEYPITVAVADSKGSVERALTLSVRPDVAPAIPEQSLPAIPLDQYLLQPIKVTDGVGHVDWTVSDGKLPYGMGRSPKPEHLMMETVIFVGIQGSGKSTFYKERSSICIFGSTWTC